MARFVNLGYRVPKYQLAWRKCLDCGKRQSEHVFWIEVQVQDTIFPGLGEVVSEINHYVCEGSFSEWSPPDYSTTAEFYEDSLFA